MTFLWKVSIQMISSTLQGMSFRTTLYGRSTNKDVKANQLVLADLNDIPKLLQSIQDWKPSATSSFCH